jgi:hypothetical protein
MAGEDAKLSRDVLREFTKRSVDSSRINIRAGHGVVYIYGELRGVRGIDIDLEKELNIIILNIKRKYGVRDVVNEARIIK